MKKFTLLLFVGIMFLSGTLSNVVLASPTYYTWEGSIRRINADDTGFLANNGLEVGSKVSFTIMVDQEKDAYYDYHGTTTTQEDGTDFIDDYFYAELIDSPLIEYHSSYSDGLFANYHLGQTHSQGTLDYQKPYSRLVVRVAEQYNPTI